MGIILRYVCWLGYPPTPPPRGARRLTPKVWVNQGGGTPPPTAPKTVAHPSGSHIRWQRPPCMEPFQIKMFVFVPQHMHPLMPLLAHPKTLTSITSHHHTHNTPLYQQVHTCTRPYDIQSHTSSALVYCFECHRCVHHSLSLGPRTLPHIHGAMVTVERSYYTGITHPHLCTRNIHRISLHGHVTLIDSPSNTPASTSCPTGSICSLSNDQLVPVRITRDS